MLALSPAEREATWGNEHLRAVEGIGAFVRCLMPVRLTGGGAVEYSVWLRVTVEALRHAGEIWEAPEYADLRLEGTVANAIQPWDDLLGAPARAEVRDPESIPWLVADEGTLMHRVLHDEWDRDDVLSRLPYALPTPVRQRIAGHWSLERSAGLELRHHEDRISFGGPGRTVHLDPQSTPPGAAPDEVIHQLTTDVPRDGELAEPGRYAYWHADPVVHNLHGYVAVPGRVLHLVCVFDDPADLPWAQHVWRSVLAL
jgi:hypothetical protein